MAMPIRDRRQRTHLEVAVAGALLHQVRHEEREPEGGGQDQEVDDRQQPHLAVQQRVADAAGPGRVLLSLLARDLAHQEVALVRLEPLRLRGALVQEAQSEEAEGDRGQALHEEQPLPAIEAEHAVELQQAAGNGAPDHIRRGDRGEEQRQRAGALALGEPPGEVEDDPGEEARPRPRLGGSAARRTRPGPSMNIVRRRKHAPDDHDRGQPAPRAEAASARLLGTPKIT